MAHKPKTKGEVLLSGEVNDDVEGRVIHVKTIPCKPCLLQKEGGNIDIFQYTLLQSHRYKGVTNYSTNNLAALFNCSHEQTSCPILRLEARTSSHKFEDSFFGNQDTVELIKSNLSKSISAYEQAKAEEESLTHTKVYGELLKGLI